jgi:lysine/arginine/ornithine transport system substrate-binding protein/histidine transport system substrate-binding protein
LGTNLKPGNSNFPGNVIEVRGMKKTIMTALVLSICMTCYGQNDGSIRFGTDPNNPPFEFKRPDGELAGFDIDLGEAICARLQKKCHWIENSFDGMIPALKAKKFDAIISAMSITPGRMGQVIFSDKLFITPGHLIVPTKSSITASVQSLHDRAIGVMQGSVFETYARKFWQRNQVRVVTYQSSGLLYADLEVGRLDAVLDDAVVASQSFLNSGAGKGFRLVQPEVYDKDIFGPGTGVAMRLEDVTPQIDANTSNGYCDCAGRESSRHRIQHVSPERIDLGGNHVG